MSLFSSMGALLRIERRHIAKNFGRSALVVLLVAVPTAAMVGGSSLLTTVKKTAEDQRHKSMGLADLRLDLRSAANLDDALTMLPPGTHTATLEAGVARVALPGRRLRARHFSAAHEEVETGGLISTRLRISEGRAPNGHNEVALSPRLLEGLRLQLGDSVEINGRPVKITGVAQVPEELLLPVALTSTAIPPAEGRSTLLVELDPGPAATVAAQWASQGGHAMLREHAGRSDAFEALLIFVLGTFGFFEAALVIGAAIAVGMRRRQREIGLLASGGAEVRPMIVALLASTGGLAAVGALIGVGVGAAAARACYPHLGRWTGRDVGAFELPLLFVFAAFGLGILSAVLSAWLPARAAAHLPIREALSGRRPPRSGSGGFLRLGVTLIALGSAGVTIGALMPGKASGLWILGGAITFVLGLGTLSPWILETLAKWAAPLPVHWRLAVRDAGRFRARNGPVVTAVIAGMSISVLLGSLAASVEASAGERRPALAANELRIEGPAAEEVAHVLTSEFGGESSESTKPPGRLVQLGEPVTEALAQGAIDVAAAFPGTSVSAAIFKDQPAANFFQVVLWICVTTGLVVIFVATALSSVESAMDARILHTVGAAPGLMRKHMASRAGYLATLGCVLAVPAGLVPMLGLLRLTASLTFVMPWSTIAVAVAVMPAIAYGGTFAYALLRPPGQA